LVSQLGNLDDSSLTNADWWLVEIWLLGSLSTSLFSRLSVDCDLVVFDRINIADVDFLLRYLDGVRLVVFFDLSSKQTGELFGDLH